MTTWTTTCTIAEAVASNIRTYRQLRDLDQGRLARRMQNAGYAWRQVTVSELERNRRDLSIAEAVGLAYVLNVTVGAIGSARTERMRGPSLTLSGQRTLTEGLTRVSEEGEAVDRRVLGPSVAPENVTLLVCAHEGYADARWDDDQQLQQLEFIDEEVS